MGLICWLTTVAFAQSVSTIVYSKEDGLVGNSFDAVTQDKDGFIWVKSDLGFNRFNGSEFEFFPVDIFSLGDKYNICTDINGRIWSYKNGLMSFDPYRRGQPKLFIFESQKSILVDPKELYGEGFPDVEDITYMYQGKGHIVWLSTSRGEIFKIDNKITKKVTLNKHENILAFIKGKEDGVFFVLSIEEDILFLQKIEESELINIERIPMNSRDLLELPNGDVLLYSFECFLDTKLFIKTKEDFENCNYSFGSIAFSGNINNQSAFLDRYGVGLVENAVMKLDGKNNLWLYDGEKISVIFSDSSRVEFGIEEIDMNSIEKNMFLDQLYFDNHNNGWFAYNDNLFKISIKDIQFSTLLSGLNTSVRSIIKLPDDCLFINSYKGCMKCNLNSGKCESAFAFPVYGWGVDIIDSTLLLGTEGHFLKALDVRTLERVSNYEQLGYVRVLPFVDSHKRIWLGFSDYLSQFDKTSGELISIEGYSNFDILRGKLINYITEADGLLWISTNNGVYSIDTSKKEILFYEETNGMNVFHIFPESREVYWLGTEKHGLVNWNPQNGIIKAKAKEDGLIDNTIYAVLEDMGGYFWLPTNNGLMRYSPQEETVEVFDVNDGIADNEFNRLAFYQDQESGLVFLGGINGVTYFDPMRVEKKIMPPPKFFLNELYFYNLKSGEKINYINVERQEILKIPNSPGVLNIEFSVLDLYNDERSYAYMLKDHDLDWISTKGRGITFQRLPFGYNEIWIKAKDANGSWSEDILKVKIDVNKPFYLQWWFYLSLIVVVVMGVNFFYRNRIRNLNKLQLKLEKEVAFQTDQIKKDNNIISSQNVELKMLNNSKDRLFAIIGHDLRTPFMNFQGLSRKLHYLLSNKRFKDASELVKEVDEAAVYISGMLDNLLNWGVANSGGISNNPKLVALNVVWREILETVKPFSDLKNIKFNSNVDDDYLVYVDKNVLRVVLRNIIMNAIKFSYNGGEIVLNSYEENDLVKVEVSDHGIGMNEDQIAKIFDESQFTRKKGTKGEKGAGMGMKLCKKMIEITGGDILLRSQINVGTTVQLVFPKTKK